MSLKIHSLSLLPSKDLLDEEDEENRFLWMLETNKIRKIYCLMEICLRIPTADNQLIEKLKDMINSKQWLVDYSIKRVNDKIYLQWT